MFLIAPIAQMERRELFRVPGWLVFLGAASYSLYLVHTPLISAVARFSPVILVTGIAVSFAGGIAYHLWVERPLLMLLKGGHSPAFTMRKPTISPMPPSP
jgi:exopolysaccharide production protein ExoZ